MNNMSLIISGTDRKNLSGAYLEIQYCPYPANTPIQKLVSTDGIKDFQKDSLYVHIDDIDAFFARYGDVFTGATYNNLHIGPTDPYGINYYSPALVQGMVAALKNNVDPDNERLLLWLDNTRATKNGIYILGV